MKDGINNISSFIVQSIDENTLQKSSSGGVFAELSKYVLSNNGVVFGCTMERVEKGFDIKHIYIENEKDIYKLQGSKYVQSVLGDSIEQAKDFLEQKRLVLFSGTPCQITGFKAFLKKDYENLITVDISCTGTPKLEIFNGYINFLEKKYNNKIIKFEFRSKEKFGWSCGNALITFQNGKQKIIYNNVSSYLNLFITKRLQSKICQNCRYSGLNRISDITLADAWGVDVEYPNKLKTNFDKNKGISLVLINNPQGKKFIDRIKEHLIIESVNIKKMKKYNYPLTETKKEFEEKFLNAYKNNGYDSVDKLFKKDLGLKYYFYILKNHTPSFIKSFIRLFIPNTKKTDGLLMTLYYLSNYGSVITAFALQKTLSELGFKTRIINYANMHSFVKNFAKKHLQLTNRVTNINDFHKLNKMSDIFILGSDNLINLETNEIYEVSRNLLNFTLFDKKQIMISGSIGSWNGKAKSKKEQNYINYLLKRFDYISTREEYGKQTFKEVFNIEADWINDPVFYLEQHDFIDLTKDIKEDYSNNIMQYILYPTDKTQEIVEYYKEKMGLKTVQFNGNENVKYFSRNKNQSVENWLSAIMNSKLIITDSFHCVAFSLIFNRPFVCIKNTHATVRFTSLFKRLGVEIPLIESVDDLKTANLNYDKLQVNKSLEDIRNYALEKIEQAMLAPKKEFITDEKMEEYNQSFIKNSIPWYKKNKLFYFGIIIPFVIPVKRLMADLKNEFNRKNK